MFRDDLIDYFNRCSAFGLPCFYEDWEYKVEDGLIYLVNYFGKIDSDFKILDCIDVMSLDVLLDGCKRLKRLDLNNVSILLKSDSLKSFCIEEIVAPNLKELTMNSLMDCESLKSFVADNVLKLGVNSFRNCLSLSTVSLNNVLYIDNQSFMECRGLENISIPNVEYVGSYAFAGCDNLKSLDLKVGTIISDASFRWCSKLELLKN